MNKRIRYIFIIALVCAGILALVNYFKLRDIPDKNYGVYIGADPETIKAKNLEKTIVIDAQYFSKEQIAALKKEGHIVYTYINLGSIETFRDYYSDYEDITLDSYENWEDEKWVDVTSKKWQIFIDEKSDELLDKGVDVFFVDNCDVYYIYPTEEIFESVIKILKDLHKKNTYVLINGGDEFVTAYFEKYGNLDDILDGVNQESVYTSIIWEENALGENTPTDRKYYLDYLKLVMEADKDAYVIEYANDKEIADKARTYAKKNGYYLYISDSILLE